MGIVVTRAVQSEERMILYYSDGRAKMFETEGGRDEPLVVPEPTEEEIVFNGDWIDQWTVAEMEGPPTPIEPFTEEDQNFWIEHWPSRN